MTAYEKEVIKAFLNEAFGQMSAEVDGQTIIPGYFDMDSRYPRNLVDVPDYIKGKLIRLPDDLKEKTGVVAIYLFDDKE